MLSNIIMIGCGSVSSTILEMLNITPIGSHILKKYKSITIFDMIDKTQEPTLLNLSKKIKITFLKLEITPKTIDILLNKIQPKDLVIDLSYEIYYKPIVNRCIIIGANYINTSSEVWPFNNANDVKTNYIGRTLHENNIEIMNMNPSRPKSTIIINQGMNPGLISQFGYLGIYNISRTIVKSKSTLNRNSKIINKLKKAYKKKDFPMMAYLLDLQAIHCSEKDTQISKIKRQPGEFMNTWGSYSLYSEGLDPIQLGWGTHEKHIPPNATKSINPDNQIYIPIRGIDMMAESYTYKEKIQGMLISHCENDTLSNNLTLRDKNDNILYRPSAYYVYSPCIAAWESLNEIRNNGYNMLPKQKVLRLMDIDRGEDAVGSLLVFGSDPVQRLLYGKITNPQYYWSGTILNIDQTKKLGFKY